MNFDLPTWRLLIFLSIFTIISCGDQDPTLSADEKGIVDSLYNVQMQSLRSQLDSLCLVNRDTLVKRAIDSIEKVRVSEIEQLMAK